MAYEIFTDIAQIKDHVGGAINQTMEIESIGPHVTMAAQKHIKVWIGDVLWDAVVAYVTNGDSGNTAYDNLMPYLRKPLAFLTLEEYAKVGSIQFGEGGLYRTENDHYKSAYKYQENNFRESMLENGYEALEMLLFFLESNEDDYPTWVSSTGYYRNKALMINSAVTFRDRYSGAISRYTFDMLRPLLEDVEWFSLYPIMGAEQYEDIKTKITNKAISGSTFDAQLLELMQKAVAYFTVKEGIRRNMLQLKGNRVIQIDALEPQSSYKEGSASIGAVKLAHRHNDDLGNRYISRIVKYLNDNSTEFPLYAAWKEVNTVEESENALDDALERFPELYCSCTGTCCCSSKSQKAIIRL